MKAAQQGLSTLVFMLVLLFAATMLILVTAYIDHNEQRMFSSDFQAQKGLAIAEAAQAYAIAYLGVNHVNWIVQTADTEQAVIDDVPLPAFGATQYIIRIEMRRHAGSPDIITISTTAARNQQRSHVTQTVYRDNDRYIPVAGSWRDFE